MRYRSILWYTQAIQKADYKSKKTFLNRSAEYLKLERYHQAFMDAQKASELDSMDAKGLEF